jgi:hypothetical protein
MTHLETKLAVFWTKTATPHVFDGVPGVGATRFVLHVVDSVLHFNFVVESFQFKVCVNLALVRLYSHLNPVFVDVQVVCDITDEAFQFLEIVFSNTARRVQKEHNIRFSNTS